MRIAATRSTPHTAGSAGGRSRLPALLVTAHAGPAVAVTTVTTLLAVVAGAGLSTTATLAAAVFAGQLTVGWGNDLVDEPRDRLVGRPDKPLASGALSRRRVLGCLVVAALLCIGLSLALGRTAGVLHLGLGVAAGHAYNLGLKATVWSWVPYAVAFGSLPAVVDVAVSDDVAWWAVAAAAGVGIAAHLLNALPDLAQDDATGVTGLPQRLGADRSRWAAIGLLVAASAVVVLGAPGAVTAVSWVGLAAVLALAAVALRGRGETPFWAAVAIAFTDVALLAAAA